MSERTWDRVKEIFHEAAALPAGERAAFLDGACAGDDRLRAEVEALLESHDELKAVRPETVTDELFLRDDFFDPRDLVQVKYEMLRRVREEGRSVTASAAAFGLSRPTFYEARRAFEREGLAGLLPHKRGPHGGYKLTGEVTEFLMHEAAGPGGASAKELTRRVEVRFGLRVHPRTIERALARRGKARR